MNAAKALALGAAVGFFVAFAPSCGKTVHPTTCGSTNCNGCCDDQGVCQLGDKLEQCGAAGASCAPCQGAGITCQKQNNGTPYGGACVNAATGGGSTTGGGGATGGGSTGGGVATGGGTATGGGGMVGTCNATNCANGCCSNSGTCITVTTPSRCGTGGAACISCPLPDAGVAYSCNAGQCMACTGCIDTVAPYACQPGNTASACGIGALCNVCLSGSTCQSNGLCSGVASCNASTCPNGCCDNGTCIDKSAFTANQCGSGTFGQACVGCQNGATCDVDAGACTGGAGGGGGGFDAGFPMICSSSADCAGGCCDLITCVSPGAACTFLGILIPGATCDGTSGNCK